MKKAFCIAIPIALVLCMAGAAAAGDAKIELKKYDVTRVALEVPAIRKDAAGKEMEYSEGYLVRLHGTFPRNTARAVEVYLGDGRIEEYAGIPDGIYFLVFTKAELDAMSGKEFRCRYDTPDIRPLGVTFRPEKFALTKTARFLDALGKK
jgi:hypothetical protein